MFDISYEVLGINNSFIGTPKRITLRYGIWGKILAEYFNEIMLLKIY